MATTYALDGEIRVGTKAVAKTLITKMAEVVETILTDTRDMIILKRDPTELILIFDLRFDTELQRNAVRDWLVARKQYAKRGIINEHTCNDSIGTACTDYVVVDSWG